MTKRIGRTSFFLAVLSLFAWSGLAAHAGGKNTSEFRTNRAGVAVGGYDAVAYFTAGVPQKGSKDISHTYKGAIFRFASKGNKAVFIADPEKYVPQYGGNCAWAVSNGYKAKANPKYWRIVDGRLFLNYNKGIQKKWAADIPDRIAKGDENWPSVMKKK